MSLKEAFCWLRKGPKKKTFEWCRKRFSSRECERVTRMTNNLAMQISDLITLIHWCRICLLGLNSICSVVDVSGDFSVAFPSQTKKKLIFKLSSSEPQNICNSLESFFNCERKKKQINQRNPVQFSFQIPESQWELCCFMLLELLVLFWGEECRKISSLFNGKFQSQLSSKEAASVDSEIL